MYSEIPVIDIESIVQVNCAKVGKRSLINLARRLISDFKIKHAEDSETDSSNIDCFIDEGLCWTHRGDHRST